jgi:selenocysteine lyase/cysteine desulfurase
VPAELSIATEATSPETFRQRFPVLARRVHLSSCSLGARSAALDSGLRGMLDAMGRGASAWSDFDRVAARCRAGFAALIGADPEQIAILPNASIGAYQAVSTLSLETRSTIVSSAHEFPSVAHVWLAQRHRGAQVRFVETASCAGYEAAIDRRTVLVSVPLITYDEGRLHPAAEIAALAHRRGARVLVDAYQAVGVVPVNVQRLDCDFLVAGAQKYLLGLPGVAFLYVRDGAGQDLEPVLTGWFGRVDPFAFDPRTLDFPASARRFETGTPAVPALYAANAGLGLIATLDLQETQRYVAALGETCAERLRSQGETVRLSALDPRGAHIALEDRSPTELANWLAREGISVSPRGRLARLSFHYYNNEEDVEMLCDAIEQYRAIAARAGRNR